MLQLNFDINPKHQLIKKLYTIQKSNNTQLATMLAQQVCQSTGVAHRFVCLLQLIDNALVTAGLVEDPRLVLTGLNKLLEKVLEKY
jgi:TNF receptor-associated protein 1